MPAKANCDGLKAGPDHGSSEIRQNERKRHQGREHRERRARTLNLKLLFTVKYAAKQQGEADKAVEDQHDGGKSRVAS